MSVIVMAYLIYWTELVPFYRKPRAS